MSRHSNLPPGVTDSMIPGNRPEDVEWDRQWEPFHEWLDDYAADHGLTPEELKARVQAAPDLIAAAKVMDALMENLWDGVPWGDTFGVDMRALNEAPIALKAAIRKATGEKS